MDTKALDAIALSVRSLSVDAVEKASSGHPGLPMGCAEVGAYLYAEELKHDPADPEWIDRDRFVLSAGHGCMLQYSLLHLAGFGVTLDDIKGFRQLGSRTPGHPEYGYTPGIEATAGPLGQGISNGVGMAVAERMLAGVFNTAEHAVVDHHTYVLVGDGDLMEGVSAEACSLAGHLGLGKLIVYYDSNGITIEGSTDLAFTEDVLRRFEAYGWHTSSGDAYDYAELQELTEDAKAVADRPSIILLRTTIGRGSPNMAGSAKVHGAALGPDEVRATKRALGLDEEAEFQVSDRARDFFAVRRADLTGLHAAWDRLFGEWSRANPQRRKLWDAYFRSSPSVSGDPVVFSVGDKVATRKASQTVLNVLAAEVPNLVGGSADLAPSNNTEMKGLGDYGKETPQGRNFHFGVREHGMGAIVNGMALHGGLRPYCATFMVFSDYMRPAIRLAAMMGLPVIYVFTHDSIYVGEDGPTHQPVEHLAALRAIPNLVVLRPGDAQETDVAWRMALERTDGPTVLALSRQNLEVYPKADTEWRTSIRRGGYVVSDSAGEPATVILATGSEVGAALEAKKRAEDDTIRVVSVLSRELFLSQTPEQRTRVLGRGARCVVVEAGISMGWEGIADALVCLERFGVSGPGPAVGKHLGVDADAVLEALR